jgi:hypothetical protein
MLRTAAETQTRSKRRPINGGTPAYWSKRQVADYFGVSLRTIERWANDEGVGLKPRLIVRNHWFFSPIDVMALERRAAVVAA